MDTRITINEKVPNIIIQFEEEDSIDEYRVVDITAIITSESIYVTTSLRTSLSDATQCRFKEINIHSLMDVGTYFSELMDWENAIHSSHTHEIIHQILASVLLDALGHYHYLNDGKTPRIEPNVIEDM